MRIFADVLEMVKEVERDLFEMGIRVQSDTMQDKDVHDNKDYETLEIQAYGYQLTGFDKLDMMIEYLKGDLEWAKREFAERTSYVYFNPGLAWTLRRKVWGPFIRDGKFAYTYNERIREQLPSIVEELQKRPNSRQAIMTVYDRHQDMGNWGGKDRVPCSLYYHFFIRENKLHMIYSMRSCDFLTHFVYDVYLAIRLQEYVALLLGVETGIFTHMIHSLHAYQKDMVERGIF